MSSILSKKGTILRISAYVFFQPPWHLREHVIYPLSTLNFLFQCYLAKVTNFSHLHPQAASYTSKLTLLSLWYACLSYIFNPFAGPKFPPS